ncbi:hypothetical protein C7H85_00695 [Zobellella endophytica]|uniref:Uncharacterized protein n=1 Tax=Zobellella endophytica TaxID=2116700 RepID=A0A2P7RB36_9GAMM|nr:hypothetical protein C7H85_00695 [Zobellella endophytica]
MIRRYSGRYRPEPGGSPVAAADPAPWFGLVYLVLDPRLRGDDGEVSLPRRRQPGFFCGRYRRMGRHLEFGGAFG